MSIGNERNWKAQLSIHYSKYSTNEERLSHRLEDVELEDWKYLIQYFGSPNFKNVSERNKKKIGKSKQLSMLWYKFFCISRGIYEKCYFVDKDMKRNLPKKSHTTCKHRVQCIFCYGNCASRDARWY
ncbi:uncharacterized protein [Nicotiana sylvestris]|uniref:uncharacterized protein n=1 Tax=Nicotiana sylvestris TaxID=4096 RepID=UPI00388C62D0